MFSFFITFCTKYSRSAYYSGYLKYYILAVPPLVLVIKNKTVPPEEWSPVLQDVVDGLHDGGGRPQAVDQGQLYPVDLLEYLMPATNYRQKGFVRGGRKEK